MKHLIIGAGNMGRRHGAILESFGDQVEYQDIGFNPADFDFSVGFDSAIICTPPATHAGLMGRLWLAASELPVFCEKPVFTATDYVCLYNSSSMVACNWRFCPHFRPTGQLTLGYPTTPTDAKLDLTHFVDVWWSLFNRPESAFCVTSANEVRLILLGFGNSLDVRLDFTREKPTIFNGRRIHKNIKSCKMFHRQMAHWRDSIRKHEKNCNPVGMAIERTKWLLELSAKNGTPLRIKA